MEIKDIIKNDNDRIFMVDLECFIVFTGEDKTDTRPFIRIGTRRDQSIRLIPLIENIIITDPPMGYPSDEQFNIDLKNLNKNKYIGKESILKNFLTYQRNFGLDLSQAKSINVEKDIPELEKNRISREDQSFTGIFQNEGNIHMGHRDSTFLI